MEGNFRNFHLEKTIFNLGLRLFDNGFQRVKMFDVPLNNMQYLFIILHVIHLLDIYLYNEALEFNQISS